MRNLRRGVAALLSIALVTAAACGGDDDDSADESTDTTEEAAQQPQGEPIIFGMDVDETGPGASYSVPARDTMLDAIEDINNDGGVLGRPIEVVSDSDESDPARTPAVVRNLVEQGSQGAADADRWVRRRAGQAGHPAVGHPRRSRRPR